MKVVLAIIFLYLIPGSLVLCWQGLQLLIANQIILIPVLLGSGIGLIVYVLIINRLPWISTFEHELTHALVALLFLRRITSFRVSARKGGLVAYQGHFGGKTGDTLISLAPYFLPTFSLIVVVTRIFIPERYFYYSDLILGFTLIYHILSNFKELLSNWTGKSFQNVTGESMVSDIKQSGYILSILTITALSFYFYGLLFFLLVYKSRGIMLASVLAIKVSWTVSLQLFAKIKILTSN